MINNQKINLRRIGYPLLIIFSVLYMIIGRVPINMHSLHFRAVMVIVSLLVMGIEIGNYYIKFLTKQVATPPKSTKILTTLGSLPLLVVIGISLLNLFNGPVFRADDYANLIQVEEKSFEQDYPEIDLSQVPLMDRDTAQRLGDRQLGSMNEYVSQFVTSNAYTQINIDGKPYRVTPLEYASFIRWFNNREAGIPAYLLVDMVSGDVEVVEVDGGMKYTDSEVFF